MRKTNLTIPWLRGFFEADGSFQMSMRPKGVLEHEVKFPQKTNSNILSLLYQMLLDNNIKSNLDLSTKRMHKGVNLSGRAPALRIQTKGDIKLFLELLKSDGTCFTFINAKQRDLMLFEESLTNSTLTIAQNIGLKKSLHKSFRNENDFTNVTTTVSRADFESRYGLLKNASVIESELILQKIDDAYLLHQQKVGKALEKSQYSIRKFVGGDDYFAGLIDGDGSYGFSIFRREPSPKQNRRHLDWEEHSSLSMEKSAELTLTALKKRIGSSANFKTVGANKGGIQIHFRNKNDLNALIALHKDSPLRGNYRRKQFYLIIQHRRLIKSKGKADFYKAMRLIEDIYKVGEISSKGRKRSPATIQEAYIEFKPYF